MKLSQLKQIIRECIEESFLVEKTPNQRKHPRSPIGQIGPNKKWNISGMRTNTIYGGTEDHNEPVYDF